MQVNKKNIRYVNDVSKNRKEDHFLLHSASTEGNIDTVKQLIQNGAQVDQKNNNGKYIFL